MKAHGTIVFIPCDFYRKSQIAMSDLTDARSASDRFRRKIKMQQICKLTLKLTLDQAGSHISNPSVKKNFLTFTFRCNRHLRSFIGIALTLATQKHFLLNLYLKQMKDVILFDK